MDSDPYNNGGLKDQTPELAGFVISGDDQLKAILVSSSCAKLDLFRAAADVPVTTLNATDALDFAWRVRQLASTDDASERILQVFRTKTETHSYLRAASSDLLGFLARLSALAYIPIVRTRTEVICQSLWTLYPIVIRLGADGELSIVSVIDYDREPTAWSADFEWSGEAPRDLVQIAFGSDLSDDDVKAAIERHVKELIVPTMADPIMARDQTLVENASKAPLTFARGSENDLNRLFGWLTAVTFMRLGNVEHYSMVCDRIGLPQSALHVQAASPDGYGGIIPAVARTSEQMEEAGFGAIADGILQWTQPYGEPVICDYGGNRRSSAVMGAALRHYPYLSAEPTAHEQIEAVGGLEAFLKEVGWHKDRIKRVIGT